MASIQTPEDNQRVYSSCKGKRCWIGFNDRDEEGHFLWSDGTPPKDQFWAEGEPDNTIYADGEDEDCAYIHGSGYPTKSKRSRWGDHRCSEKHAFVCKIEIIFEKLPQKYTWVAAESVLSVCTASRG